MSTTKTYKRASVADWKAACMAAQIALCKGTHGAAVRPYETWDAAISREARIFLRTEGLDVRGAEGDKLEELVDVVIHFSNMPVSSDDGRVEFAGGIRITLNDVKAQGRQKGAVH